MELYKHTFTVSSTEFFTGLWPTGLTGVDPVAMAANKGQSNSSMWSATEQLYEGQLCILQTKVVGDNN